MISKSKCFIDPAGNKHWYTDDITGGYSFRFDRCGVVLEGTYHKIDGPAIEYKNGEHVWCLNGTLLYPEEVINDLELKEKYPKLVESMLIYLVHNS
jgi:hypothetical protein